ncbi:hypothetical protein YTPLAS18_11320 [Nitrospira sp.]|nr:hypothetical protein YTPLAS18_11320 [Nitrospira sp.]
MEYRTVFEMTWEAYPWQLLILAAAGILIGAVLVFSRESRESYTWTWLGRLFLLFSGLWTAWLLWTLATHFSTMQALATHEIQITEGRVDNYTFEMHDGHGFEAFAVDGTRFHYSDFLSTGGYNRPASQGGVIREGLQVRIAHRGNTIAKLEVADPQ